MGLGKTLLSTQSMIIYFNWTFTRHNYHVKRVLTICKKWDRSRITTNYLIYQSENPIQKRKREGDVTNLIQIGRLRFDPWWLSQCWQWTRYMIITSDSFTVFLFVYFLLSLLIPLLPFPAMCCDFFSLKTVEILLSSSFITK